MKARFLTKQPAMRWQELDNGLVDVFICVNESVCEEIFEDVKSTYYEYDYNHFRERIENLNKSHIAKNPGVYLEYVPEKELSLKEIINQQRERIDELEGCLLEVSEIIYA